jgi:hypothetical protein
MFNPSLICQEKGNDLLQVQFAGIKRAGAWTMAARSSAANQRADQQAPLQS